MSAPGRTRVRAAAVCVDGGALLCVRLRDPVTGVARLFPPGGGIEPGESAAEAAAREAFEETGYRVIVDPASERVERYVYTWASVDIDVTTHFFAARLLAGRDAQQPFEPDAIQLAVEWLPLTDLDRELAYDAAIRAAVRALCTAA